MDTKLRVPADTDILIKAYRGDKVKKANLRLLNGEYAISVITAIELLAGAKNIKQLASVEKVLRVYSIIQVNESISHQAFQLYRKYIVKHDLRIPDCFIAATAIHYGWLLYTDNKKDYQFIQGLKFYTEQ